MGKCDVGAVELEQFKGGPFSVSGTITTDGGIPIRNVVVVLSEGGLSEPRYAVTGSLGNYLFTNVPASGYTVSISSKRFFFAEDGRFVEMCLSTGRVLIFPVFRKLRGRVFLILIRGECMSDKSGRKRPFDFKFI